MISCFLISAAFASNLQRGDASYDGLIKEIEMLLFVLLVLLTVAGILMFYTATRPETKRVGEIVFQIGFLVLCWILFIGHTALPGLR